MGMIIGSLLTLALGVGESSTQVSEVYKKMSVISCQSLRFAKRRIYVSYARN
jgi:hypothetical protein